MAYTQFASKMAYDRGDPLRPKKRYSQDVLSAVADKNKPTSPMQPANIPGRPTPPRPQPERIYTQPPLAPALPAPQIGVQKPGLSLASDYSDPMPALPQRPQKPQGPSWLSGVPRIEDFGGYYAKSGPGLQPAVMPPPSWPSQEAEQAYNKAMAAWQAANSDKISGLGGLIDDSNKFGQQPSPQPAPGPAPGPIVQPQPAQQPQPGPIIDPGKQREESERQMKILIAQQRQKQLQEQIQGIRNPYGNWRPSSSDAGRPWLAQEYSQRKLVLSLQDQQRQQLQQQLGQVERELQEYQQQQKLIDDSNKFDQPQQPAPAPGPIIGDPGTGQQPEPAPSPGSDPFPKMPDPFNPPSTIPPTDPGQQYPWQQPPDVGGIPGQGQTDDPMSRIPPGTTHKNIDPSYGTRVPQTYEEWMAMFPSSRSLAEVRAALPQLIDQQQQRALSISDRDRALATLQTLFPGQGGVGGGTTPAGGATPDTDAIVPGQGGAGAGSSLQSLIESKMKSRLQGGMIPYVNEGQDQAGLAAMLGARTGAPSQVGGAVAGQQDVNDLLMGLSQGGFNVPTATSAGKGALESSLMESLQNPYSMTDEEFAKMKTGTREGIERETQQQLDAMRQGFRQRGIEGGLSEEAILRAMQSAEMGEQGALRDLDVQRAQERRGNIERAQQALGQYTGQDIAQQQAQTALGLQGAGQQAGVASNLASLLGQQRAQGVSEQLAGENIAQSRLGQYGDILGQYRGQEMQQAALNDEMIRANLGLAQGMRGQEAALSEGAADRNLRNALAQAQILAGTNRSPIDISTLIELYTGIQRATPPQRAESPSTLQQVFGGLGGIGQLIGGIGGLF